MSVKSRSDKKIEIWILESHGNDDGVIGRTQSLATLFSSASSVWFLRVANNDNGAYRGDNEERQCAKILSAFFRATGVPDGVERNKKCPSASEDMDTECCPRQPLWCACCCTRSPVKNGDDQRHEYGD